MKDTYTKSEVKEMIWCAIDRAKEKDLWFEFEARLNDKWLNWNNWDNEDMYEEFEESLIESFMY